MLFVFSVLLFTSVFLTTVSADENDSKAAQDITDSAVFTVDQKSFDISKLRNGSLNDQVAFSHDKELKISSEEPIAAIYIQFYDFPGTWKAVTESSTYDCGKNGFLHEFVDLSNNPSNEITISFDKDAAISELYLFSKGEIPDFVQRWEPSCDKADLLLLVSHSDDEHLFFAGLLPYYSAIGYKTQVVFFTNHFNYRIRLHEQLNSLWTAGVKYYPIIGPFPDIYSKGLDNAYNVYKNAGYSENNFLDFEVEILRRFKPKVVFTHDFNGEYGHGTHMLCADILTKAIKAAADESQFSDSASQYGVWDTPKVYFHLYSKNQIKLFFSDIPMDELGGHTPFYYSQQAYLCNISQLPEPSLTKWMCGTENAPVTLASSIGSYSPVTFGLFYTTVGNDTEGKGDPFENIVSYTEEEKIKEEEQRKQMEEESRRLESQKSDVESMLAENSKELDELERLKNDYESIVKENSTRIERIEAATNGLYIASVVCFAIFAVMLVILVVTRRNIKYLKKKTKKINKAGIRTDENNNK